MTRLCNPRKTYISISISISATVSPPAFLAVREQHASVPEWVALCSKVGDSLAFLPVQISPICCAQGEAALQSGNSHHSAEQIVFTFFRHDLTLLILVDAIKVHLGTGRQREKNKEQQVCHGKTAGTLALLCNLTIYADAAVFKIATDISCLISVGVL